MQEWLWCETWCGKETKYAAKTIDLCNNPLTKEPKLQSARRIAPEWIELDATAQAFTLSVGTLYHLLIYCTTSLSVGGYIGIYVPSLIIMNMSYQVGKIGDRQDWQAWASLTVAGQSTIFVSHLKMLL